MQDPKTETIKPEAKEPNQRYQKPELKKHGKLKSAASQTTVVYTYTYIT